MLSPLAPAEAATVTEASDTDFDYATDIPPLVSPPIEVEGGTVPEGEFVPELEATEPSKRASATIPDEVSYDGTSFSEETSVEIERDEYTTTFENSDGTFTTEVSATPTSVEVDDEWKQIKTYVGQRRSMTTWTVRLIHTGLHLRVASV